MRFREPYFVICHLRCSNMASEDHCIATSSDSVPAIPINQWQEIEPVLWDVLLIKLNVAVLLDVVVG